MITDDQFIELTNSIAKLIKTKGYSPQDTSDLIMDTIEDMLLKRTQNKILRRMGMDK